MILFISTYWGSFFSFSWKSSETAEYVLLPFSPLLLIALALIVFMTLFACYALIMFQKQHLLAQALSATQLALAKEQKFSLFGALAAAAAHELGSPLNTISLAAKEIWSTLSPDSPLMEDAQLVISQTDRCRDILLELSHSLTEDSSRAKETIALSALIERAAQPHKLPHIALIIQKEAPDPEPYFTVTPDLLHGLGNILQNAFQFAASTVRVTLQWDKEKIEALIQDDGRGYPPDVLPRLGNPKPSGSKDSMGEEGRMGGHMGLGLFITKTLLSQRQGAIHFFNDGGACCLIKWPVTMRVIDSTKKRPE